MIARSNSHKLAVETEGQLLSKEIQEDAGRSSSCIRCTLSGVRTLDPLIKSQLLYQLS